MSGVRRSTVSINIPIYDNQGSVLLCSQSSSACFLFSPYHVRGKLDPGMIEATTYSSSPWVIFGVLFGNHSRVTGASEHPVPVRPLLGGFWCCSFSCFCDMIGHVKKKYTLRRALKKSPF